MPLTESGRAFWSVDETEALLTHAPRWGFSAAKLRENVAELSHFSTKQVSSKLADLQIQNRSGSRPAANRKRLSVGQTPQSQAAGMNKPDRRERYPGAMEERGMSIGSSILPGIGLEGGNEASYDPQNASFGQGLEASKKRERFGPTELTPPDAKRPALLDPRLTQRLSLVYPPTSGPSAAIPAFGHPQAVPGLPSPFSAASTYGFPPSLMLPPLLGLPTSNSLFPASDTASHPESGALKRAVQLKDSFQAPAGTKPSLLEVPHPAIRCYASADIFKIVLHPVLLGTNVEVLIPQEAQGTTKALLKIDWKLSATPFDSDFDFRRHSTLTELYHCPLPITLNAAQAYYLHQTGEAMCLLFPLERPPYANLETAIAALSTLASTSAPSSAPPTASSAHEDDSHSSSSTANGPSSPSSHAATPNDEPSNP